MPKIIEGHLSAQGMKFAIVVSRFNSMITESLLAGALDTITRHGGKPDDQVVVYVPGGWEIPLAVKRVLETQKKIDGVIALGCVMRGQTTHNEYISAEAAKQIEGLSLEHNKPVSFGVLTPDSTEQALERAGMKHGNKGSEAAAAAIEMVSLLKNLS